MPTAAHLTSESVSVSESSAKKGETSSGASSYSTVPYDDQHDVEETLRAHRAIFTRAQQDIDDLFDDTKKEADHGVSPHGKHHSGAVLEDTSTVSVNQFGEDTVASTAVSAASAVLPMVSYAVSAANKTIYQSGTTLSPERSLPRSRVERTAAVG